MARKKAKSLPPKMITVYAEILQETEKAILVRCDEDADGEWLPKSQIKYSGERGDTGVEIEIPELMADEKGFYDGMGKEAPPIFPESEPEPAPDTPAETDTSTEAEPSAPEPQDDEPPAAKRAFGDNVKWIKEEKITVSTPLTEAEKARLADEMSALDKEILTLLEERSEVSSRLKKLADAKEEERLTLSKMVDEGELRTFSCDCLKDYGTGEMVWTVAYPPYAEVQRRKMTKEEMQPSLLEYSEKIDAPGAPFAPEAEGMDDESNEAPEAETAGDSTDEPDEDGEVTEREPQPEEAA
jgi:hypothetical protein